jgi:putative ABC transport system permease protein
VTGRPSLGARIYRALVRLLPSEFRGDFGEAMAADVDGAAGRDGAFWWREIRSLLGAAAREHADALRQDVRYALRMMRRTPGFTATAVLMLALGTGANVAMFSIVDAVMLRSPFPDSAQVAAVLFGEKGRATFAVPVDRYRALLAAPGPLVALAAFGGGAHVLTGQGDPQNADNIECVASEMFAVLRTPPLIGRTFGPSEDRPGASPTIVLSHPFWQQLGGSADILGTSITLNQTPVTVIGIMPKGFAGPLARGNTLGWVPLNRPLRSDDNQGCRQGAAVNVVARVRDGLSPSAAGSALPQGFSLTPLESPIMDDVRTPFSVLMAAVACVLLIACFNVGGLQMERSLARRREMALRLALGATRGRLVRQTLTENLLLALVGALAGIVAARLTLDAIVSMLPGNVPYLDEIAVNGRVLAAALAAAAAAGLVAGLLPIGELRRLTLARDLSDATRASERRSSWGRRGLVVVEIALSIVVLIGAALMVQTFLTLRPTRPGFDPAHKLVMTVRVRGATPEVSEQFFAQLFDRLRVAPTIRAAAASTYFPMSGNTMMAGLKLDDAMREVLTNYTTPGFFTLMKVPLVAGRMFSADDTRASMPVIIVNHMLATRIRPDGEVIGQRILVNSQSGPAAAAPIERTIVGVIANMRNSGVDTRPRSEAYVPYAQNPVDLLRIVGEAHNGREGEAAAEMRAAVRELRPDLVVAPPQSMETLIRQRMGATPFGTWLLGLIAALAVGLAAIGLMTTIGWWVRQRTRELGVRIALGATRRGVTTLVFRQGMTLAVLGVVLGCAGAVAATRYLAGWIYGVTPLDLPTFMGCAAFMLLVAGCAVYFPVRRAISVDPVVALRAE